MLESVYFNYNWAGYCPNIDQLFVGNLTLY